MSKGRENKPHIAIFGACNVGKSTLMNFLIGAEVAIVSSQSGTTTDLVKKSYEILNFAPVIFIDTAGLNDSSELGQQRISRSLEALSQVDMVLLVYRKWGVCEQQLYELLSAEGIIFIVIRNIFADESNIITTYSNTENQPDKVSVFEINALSADDKSRDELLDRIKTSLPEHSYTATRMFTDQIGAGDIVLLVCPIDSEAPAGRLILPQVQATRELLDKHAIAITVQPSQIEDVLACGVTPRLIVTDSQVYSSVRKSVPNTLEITSFSILLASAKGDPQLYSQGLQAVSSLSAGDKILISESCSHQVSCEDIGRVKIPRWLNAYCGLQLNYTFVSASDPLPEDIATYKLMVQCGGCMVTRRALLSRVRRAAAAGVAVTNYGVLIRAIT